MQSRLRAATACAALAVLANAASAADLTPRCAGCNLIVISVDTVRADHLSCQGHMRDTSPAICRFFAAGTIFENAVSQSPWTGPAHASMFTSRYPHEHGLNFGPKAPRVRSDADLFSILGRHGYFTAAIHGGGYVTQALPEAGLDAVVAGKSITFRRSPVQLMRRALQDKPAGAPFALFLHGYDPHLDYKPTRNWFGPPQPRFDAVASEGGRLCAYETLGDDSKRIDPKTVPQDPAARHHFELLYDSEIRDVDRSLERLFRHLERSGLVARTVVLFTSDHGEEFFEHGSCEHVKTVHHEVLHVPFMLRVPGRPAGRRREFVPASIGLAPTVLDALGIDPAPFGFSGWSLLPPGPERTFFAETAFHYDGRILRRHAVQRGARKLLLDVETGRIQSFDLSRDPAESVDLAADGLRAEDRELEKALRRRVRESIAATDTGGAAMDCDTIRALRSLGYLDAGSDAERCP